MLLRLFENGLHSKMSALALPMVDALCVAGTAGECREGIAAFDGAADRIILGGAWVGPDPSRIEANHRAIVETFAPGRETLDPMEPAPPEVPGS